jgi:hypothetical protein
VSYGSQFADRPAGVAALSEEQVDLRVLDALGQAGLSEQTVCDFAEVTAEVARGALRRLESRGHVVCSRAADRKLGEPSEVWVATASGRSMVDNAFDQSQASDRIRKLLLEAVNELSPTTPEMTRHLRWQLPALGLHRLRDTHAGLVRRQLADLAEEGLVRAVPEQTSDDVVWLALPPVGDELLRLERLLGS